MSYVRSLKEDFQKRAIYDVLRWIVIVTGALVIGYISLFTKFFQSLSGNFVFAPFIIGIIVGLILFSLIEGVAEIFRRFNKLQPRFPKVDAEFEILELRLIYDHREKNKMVYTKRKKLRALRNGMKAYEDRYNWTGKGLDVFKCINSLQTIAKTERRSTWQFYEVKFHKTLRKGAEIDVDVEWILEDLEDKAIPFMSATIEEPTKLLSLKVIFPEGLKVDSVIEEEAPFIGSKNPFYNEEKKVVGKEHEFKPKKVNLLHHYELRWKW